MSMKTWSSLNVFMSMLRQPRTGSEPVRYLWRDPDAGRHFTTAVSLHSHTLHSREGLDFIPRVLSKARPTRAILHALEARHYRQWGQPVPYHRLYWRPPLQPKQAYELETRQIQETLQLKPLVSLTDHDNIEACTELRTLSIAVPFSHEWTVPYESTVFHIGVHNLPAEDALPLFQEMTRITASPSPERLAHMFGLLNAMPEVLVILNHPLSNESRTSYPTHARLLRRFLREYGGYMHALELNGLQPYRNNVRVTQMAAELGLPVISGGDRHCLEPNANVNLTNGGTFAEFVEEIRRERVSHVLFLPQYRESIPCRYIEFIAQAVDTYPEFVGRERWVDRIYKETDEGTKPISAFWTDGVPWPIRSFVSAVGFIASPGMRATLRLALGAQSEAEA